MKAKAKITKAPRIIFNPTRKWICDPVPGTGCPLYKGARNGLYAHFCYDWDEMLIDETDPEFNSCMCGMPNPKT